jgi:hypothetical protein
MELRTVKLRTIKLKPTISLGINLNHKTQNDNKLVLNFSPSFGQENSRKFNKIPLPTDLRDACRCWRSERRKRERIFKDEYYAARDAMRDAARNGGKVSNQNGRKDSGKVCANSSNSSTSGAGEGSQNGSLSKGVCANSASGGPSEENIQSAKNNLNDDNLNDDNKEENDQDDLDDDDQFEDEELDEELKDGPLSDVMESSLSKYCLGMGVRNKFTNDLETIPEGEESFIT